MFWLSFLLALAGAVALIAPRWGLLPQVVAHQRQLARERVENALKHLLRQETDGQAATLASLQGALRLGDRGLMALVSRLAADGRVRVDGSRLRLTAEGERVALHVVRAHRLWEAYLADEVGVPLGELHAQAERAEHRLSPADLDRLSASLGHPEVDPHGDPIPRRDEALPLSPGTPLLDWPLATPGRIVHLEDEPPLAFAQLAAEGLRLGQSVRVIERTPTRVVLSDGESEYRLAPMLAANVHVAPPAEARAGRPAGVIRLSDLPWGAGAEVVALDPSLRGFVRRRLLDLGFTPGTRVASGLRTFTGDPRAYRVRGTTIALRTDQAAGVLVKAGG